MVQTESHILRRVRNGAESTGVEARHRAEVGTTIRFFYPGYFASVMATGTLAIALHQAAWNGLSTAFFRLAVLAYGVCWAATLLRAVKFPRDIKTDFTHHATGPAFLTIVAATAILGSDSVVLRGDFRVAVGLWVFALLCWIVLQYGFFGVGMTGIAKPSLERGINGTWLLPVVATQSLSVLGTSIAPYVHQLRAVILFAAVCLLLLGWMLYILIVTLIFYRFAFVRLTPQEFTPGYWIDMGAEAITTLAGATLITAAPQWRFLAEILPFLKGVTTLFWIMGTWWIPLLVILGVWRHAIRCVPWQYDPRYWAAVFPLAMYTVSTFAFAQAAQLPFLLVIPRYFLYVALGAWLAAAAGLCGSVVTRLRRSG